MNQHQWKQKDGTIINIKDMTNEHLKNTIGFLIKQKGIEMNIVRDDMEKTLNFISGEMATFLIEEDINQLNETEPSDELYDTNPQYHNMVIELDKRGL